MPKTVRGAKSARNHLNLNVRYSSGEAKIDVEGTEVAVQTGGLKATAGIKFSF